ncbi:MAG: hypothetical protein M3516_07805 [Actinomycetota bacterium]|nr:hypothetical protein [Actinomycetota bacterium]
MRSKSILIPLAALALVAGACGGGSDQSPAAAIAAASVNTTEAGSAKVSIASTTTVPEALAGGGPTSIEFGGEGAVDYENQVGEMTMDMSDMGGGAAGGPALGEMNMVFEGTMIYMQFDLLAQQLPEGKSWVRFDLTTVAEELGVDVSQFTQFSNNDPTAALQYLEGATDLEEIGSEEVRGEETTHYEGVVDLQKAADNVEDEELAKAFEQVIEVGGQEEIPVEVWVGDDETIRRVQYAFETPAGQGSTETLSSELSMEFFDFGTEVDVTIPPDDETVDLQELMGAPAP